MFLTNSFWLRRFIAAARSISEEKPEKAKAWPDYFDNTDGIGPVKRELFYRDKRSGILLPYKGRAKPVPMEDRRCVEAHITAVAYGTGKRARRFWTNQIVQDLIPDEILSPYRAGFDEDWVARTAERMALHQRFWKAEYHYIGLLNGDLLYNNPISRYTFHGSGGNGECIGVCAEGDFPGLEKNRKKKHNGWGEHVIETNRATIRLAVLDSREKGATAEILYAHRQYSGGRIADPGEGWWKEIGIPMSKELGMERRVREKYDSGNEICREWDPDGRVNYRGKPL